MSGLPMSITPTLPRAAVRRRVGDGAAHGVDERREAALVALWAELVRVPGARKPVQYVPRRTSCGIGGPLEPIFGFHVAPKSE